jgi:hypothetical protein
MKMTISSPTEKWSVPYLQLIFTIVDELFKLEKDCKPLSFSTIASGLGIFGGYKYAGGKKLVEELSNAGFLTLERTGWKNATIYHIGIKDRETLSYIKNRGWMEDNLVFDTDISVISHCKFKKKMEANNAH